jgi:putative membrane protein
MLLFVPIALLAIARTLVFRYTIDGDELEIRSGLIFKQQRHIPFARIQNIDAIQNIFHRAVGVVDARLETAGGDEPEAQRLRGAAIAGCGRTTRRSGAVAIRAR